MRQERAMRAFSALDACPDMAGIQLQVHATSCLLLVGLVLNAILLGAALHGALALIMFR